MDRDTFRTKIKSGHYRTSVRYAPRKADQAQHNAYIKDSDRLDDELISDLRSIAEAELVGSVTPNQFEAMYMFAYEIGYGSSDIEVFQYFCDLIDIVGLFVGKAQK